MQAIIFPQRWECSGLPSLQWKHSSLQLVWIRIYWLWPIVIEAPPSDSTMWFFQISWVYAEAWLEHNASTHLCQKHPPLASTRWPTHDTSTAGPIQAMLTVHLRQRWSTYALRQGVPRLTHSLVYPGYGKIPRRSSVWLKMLSQHCNGQSQIIRVFSCSCQRNFLANW